ncbi:hypothetical protein ACFS07_10110 [Undibacterium arcticum]
MRELKNPYAVRILRKLDTDPIKKHSAAADAVSNRARTELRAGVVWRQVSSISGGDDAGTDLADHSVLLVFDYLAMAVHLH